MHWVSLAAGLSSGLSPGVLCSSSSQISDLLVSAVSQSGPDSLLLGSQAFCVTSLAWSLPQVTHWHRYPGHVLGALPSGASGTLGPCDLWWYNSSCWHPHFPTWSHQRRLSLTQENSYKCSLTSRQDNLPCSGPGHGWTTVLGSHLFTFTWPLLALSPLPVSSYACSFPNHFHASLFLVLPSVLPLNILYCLLQSQNTLSSISEWVPYPVGSNPLLESVRWSRESLSCGLCLSCPWGLGAAGLRAWFLSLGLLGFLCPTLFICALCVCGEEPLITELFLSLKSQESGWALHNCFNSGGYSIGSPVTPQCWYCQSKLCEAHPIFFSYWRTTKNIN